MSKRVKELYAEAVMSVHEAFIDRMLVPSAVDLEFAKLIVKECAEMVRIQNEQFMENESHYGVVSTDILKHFGLDQ